MWHRFIAISARATFVAAGLLLADDPPATAQSCWVYSDTQQAKLPLSCVRRDNSSAGCSWNPSCHLVDPGSCCVARLASAPQTILRMHTNWHDCFGNVGAPVGQNPPGRSMRWYAFHRQFEIDFNQWRESVGLSPIESVEWCPGMTLSEGQGGAGLAAGAHPAGCGEGPNRPAGELCPGCEAFPLCMFFAGAGPGLCPSAPSAVCGRPGTIGLPHTSLDQFPHVDQISEVLDAYFHADMHGAVANANCNSTTGNCYNQDAGSPSCSPRDPMFWRLHKALDDVVRAWQDTKAVDVVVVVDTSGSMSSPDATGISKLQAAANAVDMFGDLMEDSRTDGQTNRIGIVTYSDGPTAALPMTSVTPALRAPGGAFPLALDGILAAGPAGCTGTGAGIERALELLCPPTGNCSGFSGGTGNARKAILLLTDGLENKPACLLSAGPSGPVCGSQCFGVELDYDKLGLTQLVSVGFGEAGSLNGPLLTLVSERQGGIYLQNSNAPGTNLKNYFVKAFGSISGESVMIDPQGTMAPGDPASPAVTYNSCGDGSLTFSAVWDKAIDPADLRLLVTSPSGDLVLGGAPRVESSSERLWSHVRVDMPYRSAASGLWRAELVRPHSSFVNGFAPTAFTDPGQGTDLVRRQIHRLCPDGCKRVLYYENGFGGDSVYEQALKRDVEAGLIGALERADAPEKFGELLRSGDWGLVVSAQGGDDRALPFDPLLEGYLCGGGRAIVSDARPRSSARSLRCAGALHGGEFGGKVIARSQSLNIDRDIGLKDPGNSKETWSLVPLAPSRAMAFGDPGNRVSIVARAKEGLEQKWFVNILGRGLSKITPVSFKSTWTTNDRVLVGARILPSYMRAGGYDHVDARVEVEYPLIGLGRLAAERKADAVKHKDETVDGKAALLATTAIPTAKIVIPLNDDGVDGDKEPGNYYWTGSLDRIPLVDGHYKLRYIFDLTADGCTTRREANQSIIITAGVDPDKTKIEPVPQRDLVPQVPPADRRRTDFLITPVDRFGNLLGPGHRATLTCQPAKLCRVDNKAMQDRGDGSYQFTLESAPSVASVQVRGFGGEFVVPLRCESCGTLQSLTLSERRTKEHGKFTGTLRLSSPAPQNEMGGAVIFLESTDRRLIEMPETVLVPSGSVEAKFEASVLHLLERHPKRVRISAGYGERKIEAPIMIFVEDHVDKTKDFKPAPAIYPGHSHPPPR